jgi:hypothetical protein
MNRKLSIVVAAVFAAMFGVLGFIAGGTMPAVVFSIASGGGLVLWLATTYRTPVDPLKIIVPYLLAVILFHIHVYEVYVTDFEELIYNISGFHVTERDFLTVSAFAVPLLWLTGAILLLKRTNVGYYLLSFFFVMLTIAALPHFVSPFVEDGTVHYTPRMYTAALPLIPAGYGLYVVLNEIRRQKRSPPVAAPRP